MSILAPSPVCLSKETLFLATMNKHNQYYNSTVHISTHKIKLNIFHAEKWGASVTKFTWVCFVLSDCQPSIGFSPNPYNQVREVDTNTLRKFSSNRIIILSISDLSTYMTMSVFDQVYCTSWVLTFFFHLASFYWMFIEGKVWQLRVNSQEIEKREKFETSILYLAASLWCCCNATS